MKLNGKSGLAILLIGCGLLILAGKIIGNGYLMSFLFPLALIGLGYIGIRNGSKFFGWFFFIIGLIALFSKFSGLFTFLIALALIVFGIMLLTGKRAGRSSGWLR